MPMAGLYIGFLLFAILSSVYAAKPAVNRKGKDGNVVLTDVAFCENHASAFYVSDNTNIAGANASTIVSNVSEQACLDLCTNNRDAKGRLVFCASVAYDRDRRLCLMYRKSSAPDGELERKTDYGKRYFEKFCLADDLPVDCANKQFVRVDDYILKGYAQATAVLPTMADCVAHCVREKEFACKSAMYFYDEGECITNLESAITRPDDFQKPDDDDKVIFFHNGCIHHRDSAGEIAASEDEDHKSRDEVNKEEVAASGPPSKAMSKKEEPESPSMPSADVEESPRKESVESSTSSSVGSEMTTAESPASSSWSISQGEKMEKKAAPITRDITARLYGAKALETTAEGFIREKAQIESEDGGKNDHSSIKESIVTEAPRGGTSSLFVEEASIPEDQKLKDKTEAADDHEDNDKAVIPAAAPRASMPVMPKDKNDSMDEPAPSITPQTRHDPTKKLQLKQIKSLALPNNSTEINTDGESNNTLEDGPGYFSKWGDWTPCLQPGERRIRRRKCLDLKKCRGALMQVDYCPRDLPVPDGLKLADEATQPEGPVGPPVIEPLPIQRAEQSSAGGGAPPSILPPQLPQKELKPLPEGAPGREGEVWSPWLGTCQHFASAQPCRNNQVIGFESRECIAKDPKSCKGPFFRYCTLDC